MPEAGRCGCSGLDVVAPPFSVSVPAPRVAGTTRHDIQTHFGEARCLPAPRGHPLGEPTAHGAVSWT